MIIRGIIFTLSAFAVIMAKAQSPLPADLALKTPGADIATNLAVFAGAWSGTWQATLPAALVVEQINTNGTAQVIYSWGNDPDIGIKPGWSRRLSTLSPGKLHLTLDSGATIDFDTQPDGTLWAFYQSHGWQTAAEMERIPSSDPATIVATVREPHRHWEEIRIPESSQVGPTAGKTFRLQATIYPVNSPGRHPVVIVNHGSTGPGLIPASQIYRGGPEELLFHSLGYVEVVPMRKGRGESEGPNLEEDVSVSTATTLDSAVEDLHAVIAYLGTRPDVDTNRIVLAGVSRGGFLSTIYAGRYPGGIRGVLNFSGGWFGENTPSSDFNFQEFRKAGQSAKVPMLWLYGDHDSFYSLKFDEQEFAAFKAAGGTGALVEVADVPGNGHALMFWLDRWLKPGTNYLAQISGTSGKGAK